MELIPGLPNDVARECLVRVTYKELVSMISVCRGWNIEVNLPEFSQRRKNSSTCQKLIVMTQARVVSTKSGSYKKYRVNPVYRLTVLEPDTCIWSELPPVPGFRDGLPMFCQVAGVGSELVVIGGLDCRTWEISSAIFIFNFVTATWRKGSDMPGVKHSFFGCSSDLERRVYVVGGHDGDKNALRSALVYDVVTDEWTELPDMTRERDECEAIFHRGKLHVIGGYCTQMQGRFERSAQVFDDATKTWGNVEDGFLETAACPRTCVRNEEGELYMCLEGYVMAHNDSKWQVVTNLPEEVRNVAHVTTWRRNLMVIGSPMFGEPHAIYVLDLKNYKWEKLEAPEEFTGHVQSGCYLEI